MTFLISISLATLTDVPRLHEIARAVALGWERSDRCGFLISGLSQTAFERHVSRGSVLKATIEGKVVGYLIFQQWLAPEVADTRQLLDGLVENSNEPDFAANLFWVDSIAIDTSAMNRGVGSSLYRELFNRFPRSSFVAAIVEKPLRNDASLALHRRVGMVREATFTRPEFMGLKDYQSGIFVLRRDRKP